MPEDNVYCAYAELEAGMFLKDDSLILLAYMDLGKSFVELEQYGYALQYALYALLLAEEADDRAQAEANWLTGLVYAAIGNDAVSRPIGSLEGASVADYAQFGHGL